jgi:hypothetical protein
LKPCIYRFRPYPLIESVCFSSFSNLKRCQCERLMSTQSRMWRTTSKHIKTHQTITT